MSDCITKEAAEAKRDAGIAMAIDHADAVDDQWSDRAYACLFDYAVMAKVEGRSFLAEEVREYAERHGLPNPPSAKAWGAVFQRAAKKNLIRKIGYAPARSSNVSPKCVWMTC